MLNLSKKQKIRIKHTMLAIAGGLLLTVALFYANFVNLTFISLPTLVLSVTVFWTVNFAILAALFSGFNERLSDPSLSLVQMYWASTAALLGFLVSHELDTLFYLLLLVITVFGIFRVAVVKFQILCFYIVLMLLVTILARHHYFFRESILVNDLILWSTFCFCTAILMSICSSIMLLRARLREKNEQLQQALEIKSLFLANMSHEIRTPMNGVLGMLELSLLGELDSKTKNQLKIAKNSATSLLRILNDILDFSKIEAGKLLIEEDEFDLQLLLRAVHVSFAQALEEKGLGYELSVAASVPDIIKSDQTRLKQILINLIGNAIKFTPKGKIEIRVNTEPTGCEPGGISSDNKELLPDSSERIELHISVSDSGIGIEKDKLDHLFDSFTQADPTTTRNYGGTGLGLAITKELCELLNGGISATSREGKGSVFNFWISVESPKIPKVSLASESKSERAQYSFAGKRLLVVEDNPANQELILHTMEPLGADIELASNGAEALGILSMASERRVNFDAVMMDCQMPVMDGFEACKKIRSTERLGRLSKIPIIAITASAMDGDKEKCLQAGMNDYLTKPLNLDLLKETLHKWL